MATKPTKARKTKTKTKTKSARGAARKAASARKSAKLPAKATKAKAARRAKTAPKKPKLAARKPAKEVASRRWPRVKGAAPKPAGGRARPVRRRSTATAVRTRATPSPKPVAARGARPSSARRGLARVPGVEVSGRLGPRYETVLTPEALGFLADLHRTFDPTRQRLLAGRAARQARFDAGELPDFLPQTRSIRERDWKVAPIPADLLDRRVEITGPVDRKMIINALNSGANVYMADFEDANSPTWANNVEGQLNLKDRWEGKLAFTDPASGKDYAIGSKPAVLIVRPRGWHLVEQHVSIDGEPISGSLFDFGLYFFHNAKTLLEHNTGPYFYLPKLETHLEARLWNDVFVHAQKALELPVGTIKATVLIETLPAAFEMEEILFELRDHITGLNAGRWDYIFSFIKKFAKNPNFVLPDRSQVVMGRAFLRAYALRLIRACHLRGAFAMGGMAAQIPVKNDPSANEAAFAKVRLDKEREAHDGNDGTWVAHPDLVPIAKEVFDRLVPMPNQLARLREDVDVDRNQLLEIHQGTKTEAGFRENIRVGVQYIEAWLRGRGAVPIYNLMEDTATAEISRAQIWQWITYGATLENGIRVTPEFFVRALGEEMERVKGEIGEQAYDQGRFAEAIELFRKLSLAPQFTEFLTVPAYKLIV
jgi:malate synthase